jgi:tetratricopeptide (TPR) repeat protein
MSHLISRTLAAFGLLLLFACAALAQQITGQVRYADTGQPAFNIPVRCDGTNASLLVQTDRGGKFVCHLGGTGRYTVTISVPGYISEEQTADITDTGENEYMNFRLRPGGSAKAATPDAASSAAVPPEARGEFDKAEASIAAGSKKDLEEAVRHLEKSLSLYPNYLEASLKLGTAYMDLQEWDKAERALRRTLEINPRTANADFALGALYLQQKKYAEAEKVLKEGLAVEDRSYQGHLTLARLYWNEALASKDEAQSNPLLEQSYQEVKQALALKPDLADAHLLRGNLLLRARRAEDALAEFQEYLRLAPDGPFAPQARDISKKIQDALANAKKP